MIDLVELNIRAGVVFALAMIVLLLTYIAFFKESVEKGHSTRRSR